MLEFALSNICISASALKVAVTAFSKHAPIESGYRKIRGYVSQMGRATFSGTLHADRKASKRQNNSHGRKPVV
jgi:hypothetical protein